MGTKSGQVIVIDLAAQKEKLDKIIKDGLSATDLETIQIRIPQRDDLDAAMYNLAESVAAIRLQNQGMRRTLAILARQKIEMGTYFECSTCGGEIDRHRLLETAEVITCIRCESDPEHVKDLDDEATGD